VRRRRRIWSEDVPHEVVRAPRVLGLLRERGLELCLAVRPGHERELARTARACADAGVPLAPWPMLADRDGRWASADNAEAFAELARGVAEELARAGLAPSELVVDLEPPIEVVRAALARPLDAVRALASSSGRDDAAGARFDGLARDLAARGVALSCAVVPLVLAGPPRAWEVALGTPVAGLPWAHVSVMIYSSILEGWSRGVLARPDAVALVGATCRAALARFGGRAGASLGAVGTGAFGDEPVYRTPAELAEDVAVAVAAGVDALTLLDLGGVLARPPAEAWLDAFVATDAPRPAPPRAPSPRARLAMGAAALAGHGLALAARLRGRG
jgi:hypothetical protein